ncbi:pitrilysin family protein [Sphingomonas sp.]|jgi:zinc protease|uniref:M16 family metallopeptidase n=1 Tax=Sphingomonas sp. TaxID=28214 RepID=UPI002D802083|nr:pitrilysin family protein [Sphingomonas sp.]HEU0043490.1 pitrilysin family protein [Sphingomonas sp.]
MLTRALAPFALLAASSALAQPAVRAPSVKPLAFSERTLPNGLRVFAMRDTGTSNVSVQVWYKVGSKDDPAGRSGFAHMFEHLMFKATRNLKPEQFDRLTEDVGGYNNASTADDYTNYYEVVPANHLQRILFAEADRMASLVVEPTGFASERDVVKEELRQRTLAQPYGQLLSVAYPQVSYSVHPYARPGIGSLEDLQAASIEDVRAFHATYYRPDNAVLVVAGNFDPAQLDRWIDGYFGPIKRPTTPIPRVTVSEPPRTAAVTRTVYAANTPLPAVLMSWHVPPDRDADIPALTVLNAVLATGESARLNHALVYRDQVAQSAESFLDTREDTGNLVAFAILAGGKTVAAGEAALRREVAALRDAPVTAAELQRAKNQILTSSLRSRETAEGRASALAAAVVVDGDPRAADRQLAAIARVTPADVQRVARKYLGENRAATIRYLPADQRPAGAKDEVVLAPTVRVAPLVTPADVRIVTPAANPIAPPAPGKALAAALPRPVETRLANGLRVVTVERRGVPVVTATLVASGGAATDPGPQAGASSLAAELLTKGTTTRSATEIAQTVEALGGAIEAGADRDGSSVSLTVKSDQLGAGMAVLADVSQRPAFAAEEIERARAQAIDALTVQLADPAQLASLVASRAVFGAHPYGTPLAGTPASLKAIGASDLRRAYAGTYRPEQATLLLVGDVTPAQSAKLAQDLFGGWRAGPRPSETVINLPAVRPRVVVIDVPGAGQAGVVVARPGITRASDRYYPLLVANAVLGGGYSSRLNQEIRIKRGLAYGAGSGFSARRLGGMVSARTQTKNETAAQAAELIVAEMRRLGTTLVPAAELETRKTTTLGSFGRTVETTDGIAGLLAGYVLEGVPLSELDRYAGAVQAVTPEAVRKTAGEVVDPSAASVVVVGDAKAFLPALRKLYPQVEVIPVAALKLDAAELR